MSVWTTADAVAACWYRESRICKSPLACYRAGCCLDCFNPAECAAVRKGAGGALWVWAER